MGLFKKKENDLSLLDTAADVEAAGGAQRVSQKAKLTVLGISALFVMLILYAVASKGQKPAAAPEPAESAQEEGRAAYSAPAAVIDGLNAMSAGGIVEDDAENARQELEKQALENELSELRKTVEDLQKGRKGAKTPSDAEPPASSGRPAPVLNGGQPEGLTQEQQQALNRVRQMREQAFQQALAANVKASVSGGSDSMGQSAGTAQGRDARSQALSQERARLNQRMREVRSNTGTQVLAANNGSSAGGGMASSSRGSAAGRSAGVTANDPYVSMASSGSWDLGSSLEAPAGEPYIVRAGTVIPATLISGINSDIPGQILGQVSHNVYDTAVGSHLLIPQGTRLVGTYSSGNIAYGQERVMVAWQRLIYPDGKVLDLGSMPGADMAGYSGFTDLVDNHWWELFSGAFLMSGITAGVAVATEDDDNSSSDDSSDSNSINDEMRQALATQFGNVIAQVIQRNLNIAPTLEIRPGYRFNVVITKDMKFERPYREFDYVYAD